jgi:hypothetical protein
MSASNIDGPLLVERQIEVSKLAESFRRAREVDWPYTYWMVESCLSSRLIDELMDLPFDPAVLAGRSGKRELHNASRNYFDERALATLPVCATIARMFQCPTVTDVIKSEFNADITNCFLRIEFVQDVDGFWLEPHTDLGVKKFTFLLYLSDLAQHVGLGTDIYDQAHEWVARVPFGKNRGMIFVPSANTYHGFEKRPIEGVRTSLVINYVTQDWRARNQLAFPNQPIA